MLKLVSSQPAPRPTFAMLRAVAEEAADDGDARTCAVALAAIRNRFPERRAAADSIQLENAGWLNRAAHLRAV